jgi:multidrug efflux pump subunit AcrA (membrane-fusion protein)
MSTFLVKPGELLVTVTEDGNVESASNVDVKCQVAGGSAILWIVADGTEVAAGDKIVELDSSALEDQINTQKISYSKARSAVIQAQKNYQVAQISVREYVEGTFVKELEDAETQITIAEENLRSSKNSLEYSDRMFQRGYISELELESQQFAVKRSQLELNAANTVKMVLVKFTKEKTLEDLQSQVETSEATMESEQAAFDLEESKLKRLETQIENCTIVAPQGGMVVYANERGGRFGQSTSGIEEGAAVRDRQTMLRIPDLSQMQVKVNVHETKVEDLRSGMRARVDIQERELQGYVTSVANQPESTSFFQGNVKEYATIVKIDGNPDGLKPGMTAEVEILVAHLKDVTSLPVSAVVEQRGQFFCWVKGPDGSPQRRPLILGLSNDQFVEIKDGVAEGDEVIRNPRALVEDARDETLEVEDVDVTDKFGDERPAEEVRSESRPTQNARGDGSGRPEGGRRGPGGRGS